MTPWPGTNSMGKVQATKPSPLQAPPSHALATTQARLMGMGHTISELQKALARLPENPEDTYELGQSLLWEVALVVDFINTHTGGDTP